MDPIRRLGVKKMFKCLKATDGQHDIGTGTQHQVAQHPIDQVQTCPSPPTQDLEGQVNPQAPDGVYKPPLVY